MAGTRSSPFAAVRPAVVIAGLYTAALGAWVAFGDVLPGGRWFAVHLFTLGVLSNLVMAMTQHFAETLLHQPGRAGAGARTIVFNAGALVVLIGLPAGQRWLVAAGATAASGAVFHLYLHLRRIRRSALTQRFSFLVRAYERASGAFLHGAILGALIGTGLLPGSWAGTARLAHLHVNVLGWGGLTLLSTLVVFGPTVLRARMQEGADAAAAVQLRRGATGLTIGVLALLVSAAPAPWDLLFRLVAAGGIAVYAIACFAVCRPVLATARRAKTTANGLLIAAVCVWFPLAAAADAAVIATRRYWLLPVLGAVLLVGVLAQAMLATVSYIAPLLTASSRHRDALRRRLAAAPRSRALLLNAAVALLVVGIAVRLPVVVAAGWWLFAAAATVAAVLAASTAVPGWQTDRVRSE